MLLVALGSGIIYLSMLASGIAGVVALFRHMGADESSIIIFSHAYFNALYFPMAGILAMAISGVVVFAAIKFLAGGGSDSAKLTITFFIILLFVLIGSVGSLINLPAQAHHSLPDRVRTAGSSIAGCASLSDRQDKHAVACRES